MKDHYPNPGFLSFEEGKVNGKVHWKSPSNIALVKYWGKYGMQFPKNASLSMTLSKANTQTSIEYYSTQKKPTREFYFSGEENDAFASRVWKFIDSVEPVFPFIKHLNLKIETSNSFPHSAGIASSASAMSALALCLVDMEKNILGTLDNDYEFEKKASYIARLGSGSACRSIYGGYGLWGQAKSVHLDSDNKFAIPYNEGIHPFFHYLKDAILIVDDSQKEVSSSMGHSLMDDHPYSDDRVAQADHNLLELAQALKAGDQNVFIKIVENEALSLHALMMTSDPWFLLLKPNTLAILNKIRQFREKTGKFVAFTLDAGPNVHLLYSQNDEVEIQAFINNELRPLCFNQQIIFDETGGGPQKII